MRDNFCVYNYCVYICVFLNLIAIISAYITYIEPRLPLQGKRPLEGTPWPLPKQWSQFTTQSLQTIHPLDFFFTSNARSCDILDQALVRYRKLILSDTRKVDNTLNLPVLPEIQVLVDRPDECGYPDLNSDESYLVDLSAHAGLPGKIRANTVWGALRALETLSQLVHDLDGQYVLNASRIEDWPSYKHRGILLDTARHFIPKSTILTNLDAMSYNKFNVFHWHLVDDQSFPLESMKFPELTKQGAYSPKHVYTQCDVREIIEYARMRGIRVIPELDSPGHSRSLGNAYPELLTPCYGPRMQQPYTAVYPKHSELEVLNPTQNLTYQFMTELFREFKELFPDKYIHLGMDEVNHACWESNPHILKFMEMEGLGNSSALEQYYVSRTIANVRDIGYKYMLWQDPIDNGVRAAGDSVIGVWKDVNLDPSMKPWREYIFPIAQQGYKMVVSACWYLNYIRYPYPGKDWEEYYRCDPRDFQGTEEEKMQVIGGEACMWGEFVDGTNLIARLWPRASAVAERLWSDPKIVDENNARFRLDQLRCRMVKRGIPVSPILNGYCDDDWGLE